MICTAEDVCCPYGLIFGGTDVNEYGIMSDPHCKDIMLQAATNARFVVLCNWDLLFLNLLRARTLSDSYHSLRLLARSVQKLIINFHKIWRGILSCMIACVAFAYCAAQLKAWNTFALDISDTDRMWISYKLALRCSSQSDLTTILYYRLLHSLSE